MSGIHVNFVTMEANVDGELPRWHAVDETIMINTIHPDFTSRMRCCFDFL